jgi:hypothetical protein
MGLYGKSAAFCLILSAELCLVAMLVTTLSLGSALSVNASKPTMDDGHKTVASRPGPEARTAQFAAKTVAIKQEGDASVGQRA